MLAPLRRRYAIAAVLVTCLMPAAGVPRALASPDAAPSAPVEMADFEVTAGSAWKVGPTIVSGQPTEATVKSLAERGVKAVICLRSARELADRKAVPFDEPTLVRSLGIEFIHIPLGVSWNYTPEALARVNEALRKYDGNVLLHCTVGFRATTAWETWRTKYENVPFEEALAEGRKMGLGQDQMENLLGEKIEYRRTGQAKELDKGWLVDGAWLIKNASERTYRYLDARPSYMAYFESHLKNAAHFDPHCLRGPAAGVPAQFRAPERMAEAFALAGISPTNRTIIYADGADILSATLAMYALERIGHINTSLVDGGVAAVKDSGLACREYPTAKPGTFEALDNSGIGASLADVEAALSTGAAAPNNDVLFVDARPPEQYAGTASIWQRNGHIPGAVSVFWKRLTTDENTSKLRPREECRAIFEAAGVKPERNIIVYCGTGREASLLYMYLTRELGYPRVRLFEGGWTQYAAAEKLPVEN